MNEKFDFLPLGSIVVVSGGIKKFVIVARALQVNCLIMLPVHILRE